MMTRQGETYRSLRSLLLIGTALGIWSGQARAQNAPAAAQAAGVEDIVVTAQKREQNLQVVPISITALSAQTLEANRIVDVRDLNAVAPNLTVRINSGGGALPTYSMRGIVTGGSAAGTDKGVSLYLDGVYVQNVQGSVFQLADIERIEVLKGPQGTLFGRNATGGAISIITRNPTGKFGIRQELTYGNYDQFRSKTRIDLPKWGPVSASVTYVHSERRGDTRNLGAGTKWDYGPATGGRIGVLTSPKYLGSENIESVAAALKFDLADNLDLSYKFDYSQNHYTPEAQGVAAIYTGNSTGALVATVLGLQPNQAILTPITSKRPKAVNNWYDTPSFTSSMGHNITARYTFNDHISIKNILAFRKSRVRATYQLDGLGGLTNYIPTFGPIGAPFLFLGSNVGQKEKQWSDEIQLNVNTEWFTLTAGYIHFHDFNRTGGIPAVPNVLQFGTAAGQNTPLAGTPFVIPYTGLEQTTVSANSDAWFVQPEFHLTDRIDFVVGSRLTLDRKHGVDRAAKFPGPNPYTEIRYRNSKDTWLIGVNYRPIDNVLTYAKYSTGYISGGFLSTLAFGPETSKSWEAGIKSDLFDRRLRSNLAVYKVKYDGIQVTTSGLNVGVPQAAQAVVNGGSGKAWGFEWENTAVPITGLTLIANIGYTDFKNTSVNPILGTIQTRIPIDRPKWTGNAAIQYDTPEILAGGHFTMRLDANYKSRTWLASSMPTPQIADATTTRHTWIVNGRVALTDFELGGTRATVAAWGRNLFNCRQFANISSLGFLFPGSYERARTYGLDVGFEF